MSQKKIKLTTQHDTMRGGGGGCRLLINFILEEWMYTFVSAKSIARRPFFSSMMYDLLS
jgi:hypothetical protein